uniref:uncharacterized protein LOC122604850 n=1 Tax=Erigeron canadensis TaxID=72917 RepID=UPI001CB89B72|nr:uncharacterized protein LOC122604850 [Erigeron canadensis]
MGEEEFEESDVIFLEVHEVWNKQDNYNMFEKRQHNMLKRKRKKKNRLSVPISIPENKSNLFVSEDESLVKSDIFEDDEETITPPHIIWGRRKHDENVAYSICTERGKTLKLRDFIFKITGFLDT